MDMNEKLDFAKRLEKVSHDGMLLFLQLLQLPDKDYNYGELFEDKDNEEFSRFLKDILKNQRAFMQYKVQEWYLSLREIELQYDPLCDHDEFESNEKTLKDIVEQMGVWAGNEECLSRQVNKIKSELGVKNHE